MAGVDRAAVIDLMVERLMRRYRVPLCRGCGRRIRPQDLGGYDRRRCWRWCYGCSTAEDLERVP